MNMNELQELATRTILGNTVQSWAIALAVFALLFTILPLLRAALGKRLQKLPPHQSAAPLETALVLLAGTTRLFLIGVAVWLALRWLRMPDAIDRGITIALQVVIWLQIALWGATLVRRLVDARRGVAAAAGGAANLNILRFIGIAAVWSIALLMLLANLGVKIMPLVAGLGIGGVAIALAVQNVLGDLLASLSIALDKPFKIGDFLVLGEEKGTVEHIGIKSTRLRSLSGEQIVVANGDLLKTRVRNYGLLYERRISFEIGIVYETSREKVAELPGILEAVIRAQPKTRFDRAHFASFGDFSLVFEAVYFVLDANFNVYRDIQQAINLQLLAEFEKHGLEFAYPTSKQLNVRLPAPDGAD
jgi:small-conductance mechanosensitive channel